MDDNTLATSEETPQDEQHFAEEAPSLDTPTPEQKSRRDVLAEAFAKAEETEEQAAPAEEQPAAEAPITEPAPSPTAIKALQAWKADTRVKFDALDDDIKQEVLRRENEISTTLQKTAAERRLAQEFITVAGPYAAHYQAIGIDPVRAAQTLFQAEHTMRLGSVAQKAAVVGKLIDDYGIDLEALNDIINKRQPKEAQSPGVSQADIQRMVQQQIAEQQQHSVVQAQQSQINTSIDQFANDPKNEFFNDVAPHMIGLLQAGAAQDLQSAYEQACYANPSVRKAMAQRDQANKARLTAGNATLPVKGPRNGSSQPAKPAYKDRREALYAAWDAHTKQDRV